MIVRFQEFVASGSSGCAQRFSNYYAYLGKCQLSNAALVPYSHNTPANFHLRSGSESIDSVRASAAFRSQSALRESVTLFLRGAASRPSCYSGNGIVLTKSTCRN